MKIRCGFVSNSSSGSYIVLGWELGSRLNDEVLRIMFDGIVDNVNHIISNNKFLHRFARRAFFGILLEYTNEQMGDDKWIRDRPLEEIISELNELLEIAKAKNFDVTKVRTISGGFDT